MKLYIYAALALFMLGSCKKDRRVVPDKIDGFITENYQEDSQELLARLYLNEGLSAGADEIELNKEQLEIIEARLSAVYRLHTATTDSLFNTLKLHTYANVDMKSIELEIDSTSAEGKHVVDYEPSGNAAFDGLMSKYSFSYVPPLIPISNYGFVTITSNKKWNIAALLKNLRTYPFVMVAEDNALTGDGSDITYELDGSNAIITFLQKSDDCIDFCEIVKAWRFSVDASGKATFLGN